MTCKKCGSFAINPNLHEREPGVDLDLCDVCYWRVRAERFGGLDLKVVRYLHNRIDVELGDTDCDGDLDSDDIELRAFRALAKIRADFEKTEG